VAWIPLLRDPIEEVPASSEAPSWSSGPATRTARDRARTR